MGKTQDNKKLLKILILLTGIAGVVMLMESFFVPDYLEKVCLILTLFIYIVVFIQIIMNHMIRKIKIGSRIVINIIYILVSLIILFIVIIRVLAPSIMFNTYFAEEEYKEMQKVSTAEEISIDTEDGILSGWFLHNVDGPAPLILYFGGNAENSAIRMLRLVNSPEDMGTFDYYNIAFIDYPGYGKSDGSPSAESLKQYGLTVYDTLAEREDVTDIVVFAFSIGTGVANYVSSERPVEKLILFAPYADGVDLYNHYLNIFHGPLEPLVPYKMEAIKYAKNIQAVPLIIASVDDQIVPYESSKRLSTAYPLGNEFITIEGVGHNDIWKTKSVLLQVKDYLGRQ